MLVRLHRIRQPTFGRRRSLDSGQVHRSHHRSHSVSGVRYLLHYREQRLRFLHHHSLCRKRFLNKRQMAEFLWLG